MRSCGFEVERVAGEVVAADVTRVDVAGWKENVDNDEDAPASEALYLGVELEEQCVCEWSGIRIPAVLGGMLSALSSPVDVLLDALSSADTCDGDAAAVVFAELESLCTGRAGDADTVCGAIVSKRSVYGAGLDVGLLRLWLRSLPDAVCCDFLCCIFVMWPVWRSDKRCVCRLCPLLCSSKLSKPGAPETRGVLLMLEMRCLPPARCVWMMFV
jgi:hypothetical protein